MTTLGNTPGSREPRLHLQAAARRTLALVTGLLMTLAGVVATAAPAQAAGTTTYTYSGPSVSIPDNTPTGATAVILVPAAPTEMVSKVTVRIIGITHTWDADLALSLISPAGTSVNLSTGNGGSGDNYTNTVFDDAAATSITAGTAPFTGTFKPQSVLSAVNGQAPGGDWTLKMVDSATGDTGSLNANGWSITVTTVPLAAPGTPGAPTVVAGNNAVSVTGVPGSGGTPTSYTFTATPSGQTCTTVAPATSCVVTGLTNGTSYTFTATGTNSAGTSGASPSSAAVVPTAVLAGTPGTPTAVAANGAALVTVTAGTVTAPASYTVTATPGGQTCTAVPMVAPSAGAAVTCMVFGLTNGTSYTFRSTASNAAGATSAASAASAATTPATGNRPTVLNGAGGTSAANGLRVVYQAGGLQVVRANSNQFYDPATSVPGATNSMFNAISLAVGDSTSTGTLLRNQGTNSVGAGMTQAPWSSITTSGGSNGSGSFTSTLSGVVATRTYSVTVTGTYTANNDYLTLSYTVNVPAGNTKTVRLFTAYDSYLGGSDQGPGFYTPSVSGSPPVVGVAKSGIIEALRYRSGPAWSSYTSQQFSNAIGSPGTASFGPGFGKEWNNTIDPVATVDNGFGASWNFGTAAGSYSVSSDLIFGTGIIEGAPGAPTGVTATAGAGSAVVSWTPPADPGTSPITGYEVNSTTGNFSCTANAPATTCSVPGLTAGTSYSFTVNAINAVGPGPNSAPSNTVTPTAAPVPPNVPGKPTAVAGDGQVTVTITPAAGGTTPTSYAVTAVGGAGSCTITVPATSCVVSPLTNGTAYTFTSTATNGGGTSAASAASDPVTPMNSSYAITYNQGTATAGNVPAAGSYTAGGAAYTVVGNTGAPAVLSRPGYTFANWTTDPSGVGGTPYGPGTANTTYSTAAALSLYPAWTPWATLAVHVNSTGYNENYDGVTVAVAKDGGAFTYRAGTTDAAGNWDGGSIDPNATYQVRLRAPCDNRPVETEDSFAATVGAYTPTYTLAATVPCAPVLSYNSGTDTMSWTEPNDGGLHVSYYTYHYNTPVRASAGKAWAMFARYWPSGIRSVPFGTYASTGCPVKGTGVWPAASAGPAPYTEAPQCLRGLGAPARSTPYLWKVAARNGLPTAGVNTAAGGSGWGPPSSQLSITRPAS